MSAHDPSRTVILIVEDDVTIRNLVRTMLTDEGYAVLDAADGAEALEVCLKFSDPIDLLITNVTMPRMDGLTLAQKIREVRPNIKIIVMSGMMDEAILEGNRADAFLQKPFQPPALLKKIEDILNGPKATLF
jgi:two-component system, cell cycle sensor histidine kinase and response regulator CckA